jgi:hypothetical protein
VVTTTEHVVKAVTGFSRFECSLAPAEERVFDVTEEVTHLPPLDPGPARYPPRGRGFVQEPEAGCLLGGGVPQGAGHR